MLYYSREREANCDTRRRWSRPSDQILLRVACAELKPRYRNGLDAVHSLFIYARTSFRNGGAIKLPNSDKQTNQRSCTDSACFEQMPFIFLSVALHMQSYIC